jgi:hypothetical protein
LTIRSVQTKAGQVATTNMAAHNIAGIKGQRTIKAPMNKDSGTVSRRAFSIASLLGVIFGIQVQRLWWILPAVRVVRSLDQCIPAAVGERLYPMVVYQYVAVRRGTPADVGWRMRGTMVELNRSNDVDSVLR